MISQAVAALPLQVGFAAGAIFVWAVGTIYFGFRGRW